MTEFLMTLHPGWVLLLFPLLFGSVAFSAWRTHRKQVKLEANPHRMDDDEMKRFNRKRFQK